MPVHVRPRYPTLEESDRRPYTEPDPTPDQVGYWSERERWEAVGRRICDLRDEAKRQGVPIETLPGARSLIETFKSLGRRLDRRAR